MKIEVRFDITVPDNISMSEIEEWLKYHVQMQDRLVHYGEETKTLDWRDLKPKFLKLTPFGG